jgi:hypothetical protein
MRLYLETCKDPQSHGALFETSAKCIQSICDRKPDDQQLYFVTFPRSENLAGQRKTSILQGALPDSHASTPYFEYWIKQTNLAARCANAEFIHTSGAFWNAAVTGDQQFYFHDKDVHWNEDGHRLFAEILMRRIIQKLEDR